MDLEKLWAKLLAWLPASWPDTLLAFVANPWTRAAGLMVLVYLTILVIASVYSGAKNRAELGPVAIRPHVSGRYDRKTVRVPHRLIEMGMDGVLADCKVFYAYTDAQGKRRRQLVHQVKNATLSVSPNNIPRIADIIYGQEVPSVAREHVCFPLEIEEPMQVLQPAPDDALEYARVHRILDLWREDDAAITVSMHSDVKEEVADGKINFILARVEAQEHARKNWLSRAMTFRRLHKNRPNVIGSYYLQFEFSHNPFFVLTRHPDRDLKMTAWLTVLTSMFALVMDAWPKLPTRLEAGLIMPDFQNVETRPITQHAPVVIPRP